MLIDAPKIHTDVLWDLTILFGSIALLYFAAIFFFRNRISGKSAKKSSLKTELSPMISEFIFYDAAGTKAEKSIYINLKVKIRDMLKDNFKRRTIAEILLELRKDVSGAAQQRLFDLFQDLDLHQDAYKKLESWRWERISSGIQELTRMEVDDAYSFLTKFVNDKRTTIRKQAEIAIVTLNNAGINYFLDTTRHRISEWQQLKLIEVLSNKTDFVPPSFKAWLISKNKYVVLFALRLIKYYDQNDANSSIIELVKHHDNQIKQEAIDCIKAFHITKALPILKQVFWSCSTDVKIAILDAIGHLGSPKDLHFLESIEKKERNYSVTSKALGTINTIVPDSVLPTEGITKISSTIPEDIIENEAIGTTIQEIEKSTKVELEAIDTNGIALDENVIQIDDVEQKETDKNPSDVKAIKVELSMDFLPLVTQAENKVEASSTTSKSSVNDLEVIYEDAYEKYSPKVNSIDTINPTDIEVVLDLGFLPLVVSKTKANTCNVYELDVTYEMVNAEIIKEKDIDINALEVISEILEVAPLQQTRELPEIEVVFEEVIPEKTEISFEMDMESIEQERELTEIEVIFKEVVPEKMEISFEMDDDLNEHFDFEIIFNNGQPPLRIPHVEPSKIFDFEVDAIEVLDAKKALLEIEVVGEIESGKNNKKEQELPSWLLDEIANEQANFKSRAYLKMEGPEWDSKESQMMDQINDYLKYLPDGPNSNSDAADIIQLLDDIEIFGDEREIPLLQELMQKEDKTQTKQRIDALMKRFMNDDIYGKGLENNSAYSVFEELFRNCDTESKLILLDEIVLIGDEKEMLFLEQLSEDPIEEIREKAAITLKKLKERFERVVQGEEHEDADEYERFIKMMELNPPKTVNEPTYLQIDFDLDNEELETKKEKAENRFSNFLTDFIAKLIKNTNFF